MANKSRFIMSQNAPSHVNKTDAAIGGQLCSVGCFLSSFISCQLLPVWIVSSVMTPLVWVAPTGVGSSVRKSFFFFFASSMSFHWCRWTSLPNEWLYLIFNVYGPYIGHLEQAFVEWQLKRINSTCIFSLFVPQLRASPQWEKEFLKWEVVFF